MGVVIGKIIAANYRESRRSQWPFIDHTSARDIPSSDVIDLSTLVEQILSVFQQCYNDSLKDKWARTALQVIYQSVLSIHPSIYLSIHLFTSSSHSIHIFIHSIHIFIHLIYIFIHSLHIFIHLIHIFIHSLHIFIHSIHIFIHSIHIYIHSIVGYFMFITTICQSIFPVMSRSTSSSDI